MFHTLLLSLLLAISASVPSTKFMDKTIPSSFDQSNGLSNSNSQSPHSSNDNVQSTSPMNGMVDPQPMPSIDMASPVISSLTSLSPNMIEILNGVDQRKNTNYLATSLVGTVQTSPSSIGAMETSRSVEVYRRKHRRLTTTACHYSDGRTEHSNDCACGINICTATTGRYCFKSLSLCKSHRI